MIKLTYGVTHDEKEAHFQNKLSERVLDREGKDHHEFHVRLSEVSQNGEVEHP